jgi:hypothetical protein
LAALAFVCGAASLCAGQRRGDSTQRELQRSLERDMLFRGMEATAARGPDQQPPRRLSFAQISEDFERIQIINHALALASASGEEFDLKVVGQAASEIRKRAGRLKANLVLSGVDEERTNAPEAIEQGQLKASLSALDRLIDSFVHNPGFRSVKVIDAQWSVDARRDLNGIIELSGRLRKSCEQWQKAAQKSR